MSLPWNPGLRAQSSMPDATGFFTQAPHLHSMEVVQIPWLGALSDDEMVAVQWPAGLPGNVATAGQWLPLRPTPSELRGQRVYAATVMLPERTTATLPLHVIERSLDGLREPRIRRSAGEVAVTTGSHGLMVPRRVFLRMPIFPEGARLTASLPTVRVLPSGGGEPQRFPMHPDPAAAPGDDWLVADFITVPGPFRFDIQLPDGTHVLTDEGDLFRTPLLDAYVHQRQVFGWRPAAGEVSAPRVEEITEDWDERGPRTVRVWLPRGYAESTGRDYPVLYMHDGQNIFDGSRSAQSFGCWEADVAADRLIRRGEVEDLIIVGIDNTPRRMSEYIDEADSIRDTAGAVQEYARLIREKIHPRLAETFRLRPGPENVGIMGSSLGGLATLLIGWHHADFARRLGVMSGSFIYVQQPVAAIREHAATGAARPPLLIYLDSGDAGGPGDGLMGTLDAREALLEAGYIQGWDLIHRVGKGDAHNEAAWARRFPGALEALFPAGGVFPNQGGELPAQLALRTLRRPESWPPPPVGSVISYALANGGTEMLTLTGEPNPSTGLVECQPVVLYAGAGQRPRPVERRWRPDLSRAVGEEMLAVADAWWPCIVVEYPAEGAMPAVREYYSPWAGATRMVRQLNAETGEVMREMIGFEAPAESPASTDATPASESAETGTQETL